MRIAAGIILIVAAIINVIAGAGYVLGGGLTAAVGTGLEMATEEAAKEGAVTTADAEKAKAEMSKVTGMGTGLLVFGLFLWVMFVMQIVGAVFLFISKSKMFIFVVAGLSVVAEVVGIVITAFGWTNLFGIVGGILAFIGAMAIGKAAAAPAAPAAPQG